MEARVTSVFSNFKRGVPLNPNMNSGLTKINPGSCRTPDWRNKFNLVSGGKKIVWRTNSAIHAWVQLDLRASVRVVKVCEKSHQSVLILANIIK